METPSLNIKKYISSIRISADAYKMLACIIMLIDHAAFGLLHLYLNNHAFDILPDDYTKLNKLYVSLNSVGRTAFPIFAFFIVEGFFHTKNVTKYIIRLFLFGIISEVPFDLGLYQSVWYPDHQNVMFSLCLGLVTIWAVDYIIHKIMGLETILKVILVLAITASSMQLAQILHFDYRWHTAPLMLFIYLFHELREAALLSGAAIMSYEKFAPIAFAILYFYDETVKPSRRLKYVFYLFYPAHLLIIYLIGYALAL